MGMTTLGTYIPGLTVLSSRVILFCGVRLPGFPWGEPGLMSAFCIARLHRGKIPPDPGVLPNARTLILTAALQSLHIVTPHPPHSYLRLLRGIFWRCPHCEQSVVV